MKLKNNLYLRIIFKNEFRRINFCLDDWAKLLFNHKYKYVLSPISKIHQEKFYFLIFYLPYDLFKSKPIL